MKLAQILRTGFLPVVVVVSSCAAPLGTYPTLAEDDVRPVVVVAHIDGYRQLAQFEECSAKDPDTGLEVICLDSAPFEVLLSVEDRIYGGQVPQSLAVATTSHYGTSIYRRRGSAPSLFFMLTDGHRYVGPKYQSVKLETDRAGRLAVPTWEAYSIYWLPCDARQLERQIDFVANARQQRDEYLEESIRKNPVRFQVSGRFVAPRFGVYVDDIRTYLARRTPTAKEMTCDDPST